jgi:hypothetical protein
VAQGEDPQFKPQYQKKKVKKEILDLNDTIHLVYRVFHPATTQNIFFSAAHELSSK